jgi:hypothetical protein
MHASNTHSLAHNKHAQTHRLVSWSHFRKLTTRGLSAKINEQTNQTKITQSTDADQLDGTDTHLSKNSRSLIHYTLHPLHDPARIRTQPTPCEYCIAESSFTFTLAATQNKRQIESFGTLHSVWRHRNTETQVDYYVCGVRVEVQ